MKVKRELLLRYMDKHGLTSAELAKAMGVSDDEVQKMLDGNAVGVNTARKFIHYFTADQAQRLIDWDAIGKKNPLADDEDDDDGDGTDSDFENDDDEDAAEREYRRLNYDTRIDVEELIDLEDRYGQ